MAGHASASVSAARWLLGVTAGVVLSFVLATITSQYIDRAITRRSGDIISNAMPSIQMLSAIRGDLRQLENDIQEHLTATPDEKLQLEANISTAREDLAAKLTSYATLPFFENEPRLYLRARADFDALDRQLGAFLVSPNAESGQKLHRHLDAFDESIQRIVSFDAVQGQRLGLQIEEIDGRTRSTAVLLDTISVVLAAIALALALRQLRRAARAQASELAAHEQREAELASRNEALGEFAGRVAHDILSPLAATALSLDLVRQDRADDPAMQRAIDRGSAGIARVHRLVEDLLAFSQAGGRPEPGESAEIAPVITDLATELRAQAKQQGIELAVGPVPQGSIACSPGVLTSIVSNLVRNAIKYMGSAQDRRIDLRICEAKERWRLEVEDTGPGIPADQQERIFEPYVRLDRGAAGIGLGLATVGRLVRAHGGSIGVISPPRSGHGSLFWLELPRRVPALADEPSTAKIALHPLARMRTRGHAS